MKLSKGLVIFLIFPIFFVSFTQIEVNAQNDTIYIRADGSVDGTNKIQRNGNIYTFQDNLTSSIIVEKDEIVIDGSGFWLAGTEDETGIILTNRTDIAITNLNIAHFGVGTELSNTHYCDITNNKLTNNNGYPASIYLANSSNNNISKNLIEISSQNAIWLRDSSDNNIVSENILTQNSNTAITIGGSNNMLSGNVLDNNADHIVLSGEGKNNTITGNNITNTGGSGIATFHENSGNTISQNNIFGCIIGINLDTRFNVIFENNIMGSAIALNLIIGEDNLIYLNNFIENEKQITYGYGRYYDTAAANVWSNEKEGNYWSDYNGTDNNGDGIGDTPYVIDENNQDNYPLMIQWQMFQASPKWSIQTVDTKCSTSGGISIAIDSNNNPHISYVTFTSFEPEPDDPYMIYARWNGTVWNSQRIVQNGWGPALALDTDDNPHICYTYDNNLMYATWNGSDWNSQNISPVEHNWYSFALDSNNNPHIIYALENRLMYANLLGSSWSIQTVDSSEDGFWHISLVLDNKDNPHVIYYDHTGQVGYGSGDTRYASWNGSMWNIQIAFPDVSSVRSLVVDSEGYPHVSYSINLNLFYASWDGLRWNSQNLDIRASGGGILALDNDENPHMCYNDNKVFGYVSWNGTSWVYQIIDTISGMFGEEHLLLDGHDNPHVSYLVTSLSRYGNLTYATLTDGTKPDEPEIPTEAPWVAGNFFPEPNSVNVPIDTNVSISFSRPPGIVELSIFPEVIIGERTIENWGLFGVLYTFYFSDLLEPSTTYTVTILYGTPNSTRTWNFTTTNEIPQHPSYPKDDPTDLTAYYLLLIFIVIISTVIIGLYLSKIRENRKQRRENE